MDPRQFVYSSTTTIIGSSFPLPFAGIYHSTCTSFSGICLPHSLNVLLHQLPLIASIGHTAHQSSLRHLLCKTEARYRALPIADVLRLDLDKRHTRVVSGTIVDAVAQVAKPGGDWLAVELLDAGVVVGGCGDGTGDGNPILRGAVLEGDLRGLIVLDVGEFGGVFIG